MEVRIPQVGDSAGVVHLPERPTVARVTPRKAAAGNVAWGCLALPFLTAVSCGAVALVVSLLWEAVTTWEKGCEFARRPKGTAVSAARESVTLRCEVSHFGAGLCLGGEVHPVIAGTGSQFPGRR